MLKSLGLWKSTYEDISSSAMDYGNTYQEASPKDESKSLVSKENKGYLLEESEKDNKDELQLAIPKHFEDEKFDKFDKFDRYEWFIFCLESEK